MSDDDPPEIFAFGLPSARQLEGPAGQKGVIGTIGTPRPYTEELGKLLGRRIVELDASKLERAGDVGTDTKTGDEYAVPRSFVDPVDPTTSGVTAFAAIDGYVVFLRPRDAVQSTTVVEVGEMRGERVA